MQANENKPLISIITVCFNSAEYLSQCMGSVIGQDFDSFEYIVIDGGSSDGTQAIIEKFDEQLAYWHSRQDKGIADAWNQGLEHSRGQWLLFLNSDDFLQDDKVLSNLASEIQSRPDSDVIFGSISLVTREQDARLLGQPIGRPFRWHEYIIKSTIPHPATLTNRGYFRRYGRFSADYRIAMDYELYLRAGPGLDACHVPIHVACMREGGISKSHARLALKEWYQATTRTKVLSIPHAALLYCYLVVRSLVIGPAVRWLGAI